MSDAPVFATAKVHVSSPPDRVWRILVDAANWQSWYPDIRDVVASGALQVGDVFTFKTGPVTVEATVLTSDNESLLRFTGHSRGADAEYAFRLEPSDDGTAVSAEQSMRGVAVRAMRPMMQKIAETSLPAWLDALKVRTEGSE